MKKPQQKPRYVKKKKTAIYAPFQYRDTEKGGRSSRSHIIFTTVCFSRNRVLLLMPTTTLPQIVVTIISCCANIVVWVEAERKRSRHSEFKRCGVQIIGRIRIFHSLELPAPVVVGKFSARQTGFHFRLSRVRPSRIGGWRHVALEWLTYIRYRLLNEV